MEMVLSAHARSLRAFIPRMQNPVIEFEYHSCFVAFPLHAIPHLCCLVSRWWLHAHPRTHARTHTHAHTHAHTSLIISSTVHTHQYPQGKHEHVHTQPHPTTCTHTRTHNKHQPKPNPKLNPSHNLSPIPTQTQTQGKGQRWVHYRSGQWTPTRTATTKRNKQETLWEKGTTRSALWVHTSINGFASFTQETKDSTKQCGCGHFEWACSTPGEPGFAPDHKTHIPCATTGAGQLQQRRLIDLC